MKEAIAVQKCIIALEKKNVVDERKSKKVTFKEYPKKKTKHPFDLEGLNCFLKTMSKKMVDIKKQVAENSSKKPFKPFWRNPSTDLKPPNAITNVESEGEEKEVSNEEHTDDDEVVELQGMWDFILPDEEDQDALPVSTRIRNQHDLQQSISKQKNASLASKDKVASKKSSPKATHASPVQADSSTPSKTLIISDEMEYNIVEDMKKTRANITFRELSKLKHKKKWLLKELHVVPITPLPVAIISQATH